MSEACSECSLTPHLVGELSARGSMLRDAASAWLVKNQGVSSLRAQAAVDQAVTDGTVRAEGEELFAVAKANPVVIGVNPTRHEALICKNPLPPSRAESRRSPKGKLTAQQRSRLPSSAFADPKARAYPIHDVGHARAALPRISKAFKDGHVTKADHDRIRKRVVEALQGFGVAIQNPNTSQEHVDMAKKRRARRNPTAKSRLATKKPILRSRGRPARTGPSTTVVNVTAASPAPRKAAKRKAAPKKAAPRKAAPRKAAKRKTRVLRVPQGPIIMMQPRKAAKRKPATRKPSTRKAAPKKAASRKTRRHMSGVRVVTTTRPIYTKNPITGFKQVMLLGTAAAIGLGVAELADRFVATRANVEKYGTEEPFYGYAALMARHTRPDVTRLGVALGGSAVLGGLAYLTRKKHPMVTLALAGTSFGFGIKFLGNLIGGKLLPALLPLDNAKFSTAAPEMKGWVNRLFPENMTSFVNAADGSASTPLQLIGGAGVTAAAGQFGTKGLPPWRRQRADVGPVARRVGAGQAPQPTGVGCGCGECSECGDPRATDQHCECGSPKAQATGQSGLPSTGVTGANGRAPIRGFGQLRAILAQKGVR